MEEQDPNRRDTKAPRHRSPNYPGLSLKKAIEKIAAWYDADGVVPSHRDAALAHMGFDKFTGDAGRMLSALKSFGLVVETDGRLKLSQRGLDLVARPHDDPKRISALREAALSPHIYKELAKAFGGNFPSDTTLKAELIAARGFNPKVVDDFIKDFKVTLQVGGITKTLALDPPLAKGADKAQSGISTLFSPESKGADPIVADDSDSAFRGENKLDISINQPLEPEAAKVFSATMMSQERTLNSGERKLQTTGHAYRQDVFSSNDGDITISWPNSIEMDVLEDIKLWLDMIKRKIERSVEGRKQALSGIRDRVD